MNGHGLVHPVDAGHLHVQENPIPAGFALTTEPNLRQFTVMSGVELVYEDGARACLQRSRTTTAPR